MYTSFTRRVYKVTELAGVTWFTRDPDEECDNSTLKETRFEWAEALPKELRTGVLVDEQVPFKRVGMFIWPKVAPPRESECFFTLCPRHAASRPARCLLRVANAK